MDFLMEYYIWFIIIAIILVLSLIGYFIENDKKKNPKRYEKKEEAVKPKKEDNPLADLKPGMTLGDAMSNNKDNNVSSKVEEEKPAIDNDEVLIIDEPK